MPVKPGDILRDKLRVDALIGRGGMGQVFAATDLDTRGQVAVKVVSRLFVDETLMLRLHREAVAAQRIRSDYVPRVFEVNDTGDGETYLVMERLMGEPLSARIRSQGALPWPEVSRLGEEILRGIIDAHAAGIIHRDLKPSNVFLALKTGRVRAMVLDFGVCKMDGVDTERLTGTGESIGTVAYMAPEQIRGAAKVDERADIYAFGVLVFEMLSGRLPHEGPSQMAILASKLEKESARLRECVRYPIPEQLDALVMQCLSRDPQGRQPHAQDVLRQWRILARAEGFVSGPTIPPSAPGSLPARSSIDDDPPTEISKPNAMPPGMEEHMELLINGSTSDDENLPPTGAGAEFSSMFPPAQHTTDVPVAVSGNGVVKSGARMLMFACIAMGAIVICIFAFKLSRPDAKRVVTGSPAPSIAVGFPPAPTTAVATDPGPVADGTEAPPATTISSDDSLELPSDPAPVSVGGANVSSVTPVRPRPQPRPHPPAPAPAPKASTPRITSQPRY